MYYITTCPTPLGEITLMSDGEHLIGLWLENQKYFLGSFHQDMIRNDELDVFQQTKDWLSRYFHQDKPLPSQLPLSPIGTDFQKAVWNILCQIPYGEVTTYGKIAQMIMQQTHKKSMSAQAVGSAVAHNPISIIIPCHRVVGSQGSLTGYAGGIDKKIKLLQLEGIDTNLYSLPKGDRHANKA